MSREANANARRHLSGGPAPVPIQKGFRVNLVASISPTIRVGRSVLLALIQVDDGVYLSVLNEPIKVCQHWPPRRYPSGDGATSMPSPAASRGRRTRRCTVGF